MPEFSSPVRWLVPGQMLLVNRQVLPIQGCQIVLPRRSSRLDQDDWVPKVEFWFSHPIQGATAYVPRIQSGKAILMQVREEEQVKDWKDVQWLVVISGDAAIAVRRLILQLAKQNTPNPLVPKQTKTALPAPKSIPTPDARKYQVIVKNQPKPHRVDLNVLDFIDSDLLDLDDE